jgi:hypothetical protein
LRIRATHRRGGQHVGIPFIAPIHGVGQIPAEIKAGTAGLRPLRPEEAEPPCAV